MGSIPGLLPKAPTKTDKKPKAAPFSETERIVKRLCKNFGIDYNTVHEEAMKLLTPEERAYYEQQAYQAGVSTTWMSLFGKGKLSTIPKTGFFEKELAKQKGLSWKEAAKKLKKGDGAKLEKQYEQLKKQQEKQQLELLLKESRSVRKSLLQDLIDRPESTAFRHLGKAEMDALKQTLQDSLKQETRQAGHPIKQGPLK